MTAVTDLVEQLRAQSVELRAEKPTTVKYPGGAIRFDWQRDWFVSLADLIDGMLERHLPIEVTLFCDDVHPRFPECGEDHYGTGCQECCAGFDDELQLHPLMPCPTLLLLARHVTSVIGEVTA